MKRTLEELKELEEKLRNESCNATKKLKDVREKIAALTERSTKDYIGKYIHHYNKYRDTYAYITSAESHYDGSWGLKGNGFNVWTEKDGKISLDTRIYEISVEEINKDGYSTEIITKEEFYQLRKNWLDKINLCPVEEDEI